MVLNYIWIGFFLVGLMVALFRTFGYLLQHGFDLTLWANFNLSDRDVFVSIVNSTFSTAKTSIEIAIYLIGIMTLWLGIMKIGEKGGAVNILSRMVSPFFRRIFPEIPKNHPAMGSILMNFCANMLGLDNAATPFGRKAMNELQELNPKKDTASNAQILFLVLNTSGLTLIPISIIGYRALAQAANPADVFLPLLLSTFCAFITGLVAVSIVQRINLLNKVILLYLGTLILIVASIYFYSQTLTKEQLTSFSVLFGDILLFSFIIFFIFMGLRKRINLYETFIEGAKDGFGVAIKIIPYLVAMLVAIGVFSASGAMDYLISGISHTLALLGINTDFVRALPVALMKPLSGNGSRAMMIATMKQYGPDSFVGHLSCIFQGSTETTFYIVAVYYGAVGIIKTRYTITCGLLADLAGMLAAIFWANVFFR
jgi:spore maturation protein SpmA